MHILHVQDAANLKGGLVVVFQPEDADIGKKTAKLCKQLGISVVSDFSGKSGRNRVIWGSKGIGALLLGIGKAEGLTLDVLRSALGTAVRLAASQELPTLVLADTHLSELALDGDVLVEALVAIRLAAYRFVAFKSEPGTGDCPDKISVLSSEDVSGRIATAEAIASGVELARDLVNTPANTATPEYMAQTARDLGVAYGFGVQVFGQDEIIAMGMGSFASVFRGSDTPARFIVLDSAPQSGDRPLVFVGKGVTFDTGGISLKPAAKMHEMKGDMGGAAAILGLFKTLGMARSSRRVVGLLPCTENVPGSRATKPGDVVTAMNGKTIEILNTDAEGRLILADALCYSARYEPEILVDLATLTGACLVALGTKVAAVFSTSCDLDQHIREGGSRVGERYWPMPLWDEYGVPLKSDVADLKNIAVREGGAIFAALFLKNFVPEGVDWAHLDIAGPAWTDENSSIFKPGGTGFGVRTLWELVQGYSA